MAGKSEVVCENRYFRMKILTPIYVICDSVAIHARGIGPIHRNNLEEIHFEGILMAIDFRHEMVEVTVEIEINVTRESHEIGNNSRERYQPDCNQRYIRTAGIYPSNERNNQKPVNVGLSAESDLGLEIVLVHFKYVTVVFQSLN